MNGAATPAPESQSRPGRRIFELLHHLLAAALMASAMLSLEKIGSLEWLDALMLSVVATEAPAAAPPPSAALPQVVLIDDIAYADTFGLRSPLDRAAVGRVIEDALSAHPTALLVDLQLEPAVGEDVARPLDALLAGAAKAPGVRIALPLPLPRTPALNERSMAWMRQMCEAGVHFGSAQVRSHFGTVVRLDRDVLSIAQVTHAGGDGAQDAGTSKHAPGGAVSLCLLARQGAALDVLWGLLKDTEHHGRREPLPPAVIKRLSEDALRWRPQATAAALQRRPGGTVVIGGAYDDRDRFVTSALPEPVPGALVHATALTRLTLASNHAAAWGLDVIFGTALGLLFSAAWRWVGTAHLPQVWRWADVIGAWRVPARSLLLWLAAALVAYALMKASGGLMAWGLWLNPGPMVLGMLLHTLLLKDEAHHAITAWREYTRHHPAWPLQLGLIALGLGYGLSGPH